MGSLTGCITKAGKALSRADRDQILAVADQLRREGETPAAAARAAVMSVMDSIKTSIDQIKAEVDAPFEPPREMNAPVTGGTKGVLNTMRERFMAAGRSPAEAEAIATMISEFYRSAAIQLGRSVDSLVQKFGLPEVRQAVNLDTDIRNTLYQSEVPGNVNGFEPALRETVDVSDLELPRKPLLLTGTNIKNAGKQIDGIDETLGKFPDPESSPEEWSRMMAYATANAEVPIPPYAFIRDMQDNGARAVANLAQLTPGQVSDADHGFANAAKFRQAYIDGKISPKTTGKLFLWSFLSRGVSPYTQEGLFIDAFDGIETWLDKAAAGQFGPDDFDAFDAWAKTVAPQGSGQPGAGAIHNLNAFGKLFLYKMSQQDESGVSRLQKLHDLMSDPNQTGQSIRRWLMQNTEGVGIDNKVVSFTLLVAGHPDVMVLDRVQIRQLWDDGRYSDINLYDGRKVDGKVVSGSALADLTYGARGLLVYEAIERALAKRIDAIYTAVGRPEAASVGRYHWESWVASSQQEASHGTLDAILADAEGSNAPLAGVTAKEGEYGGYAYGARYGREPNAAAYFEYKTPSGGEYRFTVAGFREFMTAIKQPKNGVIPPGFKVTESGNGPWYNRAEVNKERLDDLAKQFSEDGEGVAVRAADGQAIPDVAGRPAADGRGSGGSAARDGRDAPLAGAPKVEGASGPDRQLVSVAEQYARENGIELRRQAEFVEVDPERAARIAAAYEAMPHAPDDPRVKAAYQELIRQTTDQYRALESAGYKFWFIEPGDAYADSPWTAMRDLRANKSMGVFPTDAGFGTREADIGGNPLLADTGIQWPFGGPDGPLKPVSANDLFRAVHDAFGHGVEGAGFRARGEENAWQAHVRLFYGDAVGAITTETRGQNSWLNYGPYGEKNRTAKVEDTVFADQKTGLMPEWTWLEGRAGDMADVSSDPKLLFQQNRGAIQFGDDGRSLITLFEGADPSTALHETGHHFLSMFKSMAERSDAPAEMRADWEITKAWWSDNADAVAADAPSPVTPADVRAVLETGTTGDRVKDLAVNVGLQEQWARGFEAYAREGVAPSEGLRRVFQQFKAWLTAVYKRATDLNVNLTPEMRGVFDRLLAPPQRAEQPRLADIPPRPEPASEGLAEAAAKVGRDETMKEMSEDLGVDITTGEFEEMFDIDQLRAQGLLSKADEDILKGLDKEYEQAEEFGNALKAAMQCVL